MRTVEALPSENDGDKITFEVACLHLATIHPLSSALESIRKGSVDTALYDHAMGIMAEAASRIANAPREVIQDPHVRGQLKAVLLFAATAEFPYFDQAHEDDFHEHAHWGGPSARTSAAFGLIALVRFDRAPKSDVMDAIRTLARDPVCQVRLQIVQNLHLLREIDQAWMWSEIEHVVTDEFTREVVSGALQSLAKQIPFG